MRWPKPLLRRNPHAHKNDFGHVLILAGSAPMIGAAALVGLAAMRSGAGLVTCAIPQSLNLTLQKKISSVIMTLPLPETRRQALAFAAYKALEPRMDKFNVIALGPGLGQEPSTQRLIRAVIGRLSKPLVIDADALNALAGHTDILLQNKSIKILTPHAGEMARLTGLSIAGIEKDRQSVALAFARRRKVFVVLKGHRTVIASPDGQVKINKTGNAGMAKAGSGDVLTGILAALLAQGIDPWKAVELGVYLHGKAGDLAAKTHNKAGMIATDIVANIPVVFKEMAA
jgi:hydroxyethylthiazole kinase-like uncharacterized protein yjeF